MRIRHICARVALFLALASPSAAQLTLISPDSARIAVHRSLDSLRVSVGVDADSAAVLAVSGPGDRRYELLLSFGLHSWCVDTPMSCLGLLDVDFDGYLDIRFMNGLAQHDQTYDFWRFNRTTKRFEIDDVLSVESGLPEIDRKRREITFSWIDNTGMGSRIYRLAGGHFVLTREIRYERLEEGMIRETVYRVKGEKRRRISTKVYPED